MKIPDRYFFLLCALFFFAVGVSEAAAQNKSVAAYAKVKLCLDETDAAYKVITNQSPSPENNRQTQALLEKLIGCANEGLAIRGLPAKTVKDLAARRNGYLSERETSLYISCAAEMMIEVDNATPSVDARLEAKDKTGALRRLQTVRSGAVQAKSCVQQALDSPRVAADIKAELQDTMRKLDSLLASFDSLKKTIESIPNE